MMLLTSLCLSATLFRSLPNSGGRNETAPLAVVVFYDSNRNGVLDSDEIVRLPGVTVSAGGVNAVTEPAGRALLASLPAGPCPVVVHAETLPPFFEAGGPLRVTVPTASEVALPVTLPIGENQPNTYMAFGDSLTDGDNSSDEAGYRNRLETKLRRHWGAATVINEGVPASDSHTGARRLSEALARHRPAYTLILYGTNDYAHVNDDPGPGFTVNSLRRIVRAVRAARSLPFLATLPPSHIGADERASPARNDWTTKINAAVRVVAKDEGAVLVDLEAAFRSQPDPGALYADGLHPNDRGYELIATAFFAAITGPRP